MVNIVASKTSKHLIKGDHFTVGKETAILLISKGLAELA
jgi:hypothetical protein